MRILLSQRAGSGAPGAIRTALRVLGCVALGAALAGVAGHRTGAGPGAQAVEASLPGGPAASTPATLTVGSISLTIEDEFSEFQPLADYLARRLSHFGIRRGQVVVATNLDGMEERARQGAVDLYIDSPFPVAVLQQRVGFRPLLRRWKKGVAKYHAVVIVRADSPIASLADLRGRMIAFDEPFSTSGYLLPKATLLEGGVAMREYPLPTSPVAPVEAGYVFSRDDENTLLWVLKGRVAAGAIDNLGFRELVGSQAGRFRVVARTVEVPRQVVALRPDLDPALAAAIEGVLIDMHRDDEGRRVLDDFQDTSRFDRFPEGAAAGMADVTRLMSLLATDLH